MRWSPNAGVWNSGPASCRPRAVIYSALAMCLFSGQGYEEAARLLTHGLERVRRWEKSWRVNRSDFSAAQL